MPTAFLIIEVTVFALVISLMFHAKREGYHWLSTLLWGIVFGTAVELLIVHGANPSAQHYVYGDFLVMVEVGRARAPLWVGFGWGGIAYAASWTAQRLGLSRLLHPAAAGVLAVSLDFSLDPVAELEGFWRWQNVRGLSFFGVPFDNFLGWFAIVGLYSGSVRTLFHWLPARGSGPLGRVGSVIWVPALGAVFATLVLRQVFAPLVDVVYELPNGELWLFNAVFAAASCIVWFYAMQARRDQPTAPIIVAMPLAIHAVCLVVIVFTGAFARQVELMIVIPVNMVASFLGFTWVSIDVLFPVRHRQALGAPLPDARAGGVHAPADALAPADAQIFRNHQP